MNANLRNLHDTGRGVCLDHITRELLTSERVSGKDLAGDPIIHVLNQAPGNGAAIGGLKVITEHGWFAARPSGTEDIYKIYVESFHGEEHLHRIANDAQAIIDAALGA